MSDAQSSSLGAPARDPGPTDADLILASRAGDDEAYAELYRRHSQPALRFARSLGRSADPEDLVAEAFARVLAAVRSGNGPGEAFRPYLLSAVRNAFYDSARRAAKEQAVDDLTPLAPEVPFADPMTDKEESRLVATAFGELPERWQIVLWHTEVEGEKPAQVAPLLGISANAVAALAYRAREGLRERYLRAHVSTATNEVCRPTVERLAAYTRRKLSRAEAAHVRSHLDACAKCSVLFVELSAVNARLGALIGPVVLGGAAGGYAAGVGTTLSTAAAGAFDLLRRIVSRWETQVGGAVAATAGAVALVLPLVSEPSVLPGQTPTPGVAAPSPEALTTPRVPSPPLSTSALPTTPPAGPAPTGPGAAHLRLAATVEAMGSLVRGYPGVLALTVANPRARPKVATGALTATFTVPAGVTLRNSAAGDGWGCASTGTPTPIICTRGALEAGATTRAYVHVSVAASADGGVPSVALTGTDVAPSTATASEGVQESGLGAVLATSGPVGVVAGGNSLLSCHPHAPGCAAARFASPQDSGWSAVDNDDYVMTPFRDPNAAPGAPPWSAVSGAQVALGAEVMWAGLYWAGTGTAPASPTAYVRAPGSPGYQAVAADRVSDVAAGGGLATSYQASADVTALARAADGNGTWWVAVDRDAFADGVGAFGGWALLAVVKSGGDVRTVAILDAGFAVRDGAPVTSTVYGLAAGTATVGLVAWEGDRGKGGDTLTLDGVALRPPFRTNVAYSRADGTPLDWNTFGTDARAFPGGAVAASDGTPPVIAATTYDSWVLGALAIVTAPDATAP